MTKYLIILALIAATVFLAGYVALKIIAGIMLVLLLIAAGILIVDLQEEDKTKLPK